MNDHPVAPAQCGLGSQVENDLRETICLPDRDEPNLDVLSQRCPKSSPC